MKGEMEGEMSENGLFWVLFFIHFFVLIFEKYGVKKARREGGRE